METEGLLRELYRGDGSGVIVEDPVLGLTAILSFDNELVFNNVNCITTLHSGVDRERNTNLESVLLVGLTF